MCFVKTVLSFVRLLLPVLPVGNMLSSSALSHCTKSIAKQFSYHHRQQWDINKAVVKSDLLHQKHWSMSPGGGKWSRGCSPLPPPVLEILSCRTAKISMKGRSLGSSPSLSSKDPPAKASLMLQGRYSGISGVSCVFVPWVSTHRDSMGSSAWSYSVCRKRSQETCRLRSMVLKHKIVIAK